MSQNPVDSFLCVGLALVDLIVEVDRYPIEDDKCRYASNPLYCSSNSIMFILNEFLIYSHELNCISNHVKIIINIILVSAIFSWTKIFKLIVHIAMIKQPSINPMEHL